MKKFLGFVKRAEVIVAGLLLIPALYGGASVMGADLPRWAWYSELEQVAASQTGIRYTIAGQELSRLKYQRRLLRQELRKCGNCPQKPDLQGDLDDVLDAIKNKKIYRRKLGKQLKIQ